MQLTKHLASAGLVVMVYFKSGQELPTPATLARQHFDFFTSGTVDPGHLSLHYDSLVAVFIRTTPPYPSQAHIE
ncbi:hypothetical protein [Absidia glauca]|uniref:Uncharacterized protein n=1 Tax=Absidia glauca TaxID=4829 RepID=A0A168REE6_ABSGL|nr:hypothetical protein [Absidia glauca]